MSGIRVTYSGLIAFAVGISSIITGLFFILIVTRQLTAEELGTWTLIGGLLVYVMVIEPIVSYWTTREIARGEKSAKTALITSTSFSGIAIIIYLGIVFFVSLNSEIDKNILYFGAILIPITFVNRVLLAINYGTKSYTMSIGILGFEISKIPFGVLFVYVMKMGVEGAIIAIALAYSMSSIILFIFAKDQIKDKINYSYIKKWFKLSWISTFPQISIFITRLDMLIFIIFTGGVTGLAYYSVAFAISSLPMQASGISRAVYPKLLSEEKGNFLQENLTKVFYFVFPLTAISLTFMEPALFALNPIYQSITIVVLLLTIKMSFGSIFSVLYQALLGIEKVDKNQNINFKDFVKSKLFTIPLVNIIKSAIYIILLAVIFFIFSENYSDLDLVIFWMIILLISDIPYYAYILILTKRNFELKLEKLSITKYAVTTILVFIPLYFLMKQYLVYEISIFDFLPNLVMFVAIGIISYIGITFFIDNKTKNLVYKILNEIKGKK